MAGEHDQEMQEPRRHLMAAREDCIKWLKHLRRALQGLPKSPSAERARLELHGAVMTYYDQLRRFRSLDRLEGPWHEQAVADGWTTTATVANDGELERVETPMTLELLGQQRLDVDRRKRRTRDPDTNATTTEIVEDAWSLSRQQALAVIDQLDTCAHKLGFDIQPSRQAKVTGAGKQNGDTPDPEDMEHLNANPLEMGANGD